MNDEGRTLLGGRYLLVDVLGEGGMGTVWRAEDTLLRRQVAVKELRVPRELPAKDRALLRERMLREARAAAGLNHRNAVTVFDVVDGEGDAPYLVMELLDSPTLETVVATRGPLQPGEVATVGAALADVLALAHERGIVHRDVKPSNIMIGDDGSVKLTDFGIATVQGDPRITATGLILGSPSFMSPEQAQGRGGGPLSDVWGLGASLLYALTGSLPFDRGSPIATLNAVIHDDVDRPPGGGRVGDLVCGMLSKDPSERPTMIEAKEQLAALAALPASDEGPTDVFAPVATPDVDRSEDYSDEPATGDAYDNAGDDASRRRALGVLVALLLAAALGTAAFALLRNGGDEPPGPGSDATERVAGKGRNDRRGGGGAPSPTVSPVAGTTAPVSTASPVPLEGEWVDYVGDHGIAIQHPPDWQVVEGRGGPTSVDFVEPETGNYLRLGYRTPPGENVLGTLEGVMDSVAQRYPDYEEIRLEKTTFRDFDAAIAEYLFSGQHAVNLQFVTGPPERGEFGFALNFVTDADDWDAYAPVFERFQATFAPPE